MANLFAGLLKQARPAINAGNNVLQDLGILRPQAVNLNDIKRVEELKANYATKELPKQVEKYKKTTDSTFQNINKILDNADDISESEKENLRKLAQQKQKSLLQATQAKAVQKQERALTGVAPEQINQFGVKKAQIDIKKQIGQPLNTQEQTIDTFSNPIISFGAGLLEKTAQFGKDLNTGLDSVASYQDQALRSVPIIGQGIKALDNLKVSQINQDLNKDISADQRVDLLKRKSQLEATPEIQRQAIKADYQNPNFIKNAQNKTLGSKELAEGMRQQGGYKTGEFAGEILPFFAGGEVTGAAKLATGGAKALMKTGIGKALAKYGGKETVEVLTKGVIENAIVEQPMGLIQEGAKVAGGEQTLEQAAQNQLGRTALAAGLGGVAELGIHNVGKALKPTFDKLGRAKKFEEITTQRQAVQGERQARNADIEELQNALQMQEQGQAVEALMPNYKTKIAQNTASQAQKDINQTIANAQKTATQQAKNAQKTVTQQAKEEAQLQTALNRLEQKSVKVENAQYKQEAQIGKQAVKEVNQTIKQAEKEALLKLKEDLKAKRLQEAQNQKEALLKLKKNVKAENAQYKQEAQIGKQAVKEVNQTINQAEIPSTPQKTVSEANKVPSVLTPNKSASVLTQPSAKALPEVPKVEGLKGSGKQIDEAVAQRPPKEVKQAQSELRTEYKNVLSNESQLAEKPLRDGLEELGFEIKSNKKGDKFAQLGNVRISLKDVPPPYSVSGLKDTYKNKIASAKAANDIRSGGTSVDGVASEFLDDIQANKFLDEFDGEAAYKHKKFNDDLNNAKTYEELEKVGEEHSDLMGVEGEYFDSYTKKLGEIVKEPVQAKKATENPKNQTELEQTYKTTFGLDEPKGKAAAVVTDRIFDTIARRKGITKEAAYSEVGFKKSNLNEVGKGAKFQGDLQRQDLTPSDIEIVKTGSLDDVKKLWESGRKVNQIMGELSKRFHGVPRKERFQNEFLDYTKQQNRIKQDVGFQPKKIEELKKTRSQTEDEVREELGYDKEDLIERKERFDEASYHPELEQEIPHDQRSAKLKGDSFTIISRIKSASRGKNDTSKSRSNYYVLGDANGKPLENLRGGYMDKSGQWVSNPDVQLRVSDHIPGATYTPTFLRKKGFLQAKDDLWVNSDGQIAFITHKPTDQAISSFVKSGQWDGFKKLASEKTDLYEAKYKELNHAEIKSQEEKWNDLFQKKRKGGENTKFQNEKGAMETLESGKKVIHALTDPNVSTPLHEIAHVYEEVLTKSERTKILDWAGSKEWDTNASEKFARGFERYLSEGKAPIPELKQIFDDFKDWLVDIYKGITGSEIDLKLNNKMRKIYDEMLGTEAKVSKVPEAPKFKAETPAIEAKVPEAPKSDLINKPDNLTGETKERGLIQTIDENPNFKQETKEFRKDTTYETRNSNDLFDRATERVKTQDSESLAKEIRMKSRKESNWTDEEVATGYELVRKYESEGLLDEAAELEDALARKATEGGQMIQAYYRFGKMTPEGAIREANKVLEKAMPKAKAQKLKEATANVIKDFNKANKKAIEDILNFCPPGSFS
jgi:hypothetical protein